MSMKTITLHQPWASLVAQGVKTIETRSWKTSYRGPLAIHAGMAVADVKLGPFRVDFGSPDILLDSYHLAGDGTVYPLPRGAVVAIAQLVDVVPIETCFDGHDCLTVDQDGSTDLVSTCDPWADEEQAFMITDVSDQRPYGDFSPGRFAWILSDIKPVDPVPAKGRQGLWDWEEGE